MLHVPQAPPHAACALKAPTAALRIQHYVPWAPSALRDQLVAPAVGEVLLMM